MSRICISIFLAALLSGGVLWYPWQQVNADRAYLETLAVSGMADALPDFVPHTRPFFHRELYIPPITNTALVEEAVSESENESFDEAYSAPETVVTSAVSKEEDAGMAVPEEPQDIVEYRPETADPLMYAVLSLLNAERSTRGFAPLMLDQSLHDIATAHSEDMARNGYLAHEDETGCNLTCRLGADTYKALAWAENIVMLEKEYLLSTTEVAEHMMESWMGSGSHRVNIENGDYTHVGIGIARNGSTVYVTTDFALPK